MLKTRLLAAALVMGLSSAALAQNVVGRALVDGEKVVLFSDRTWAYESAGTGDCSQIHAEVQFCGNSNDWQTTTVPSPDVSAAYRFDDRHYAQFIIEAFGTKDGVTARMMRDIVIENAATGTGQSKEDVTVISVEDTVVDGIPSETVVYQFAVDNLDVVFANSLVITDNLTMQAITYAIASEYSDLHQRLHADVIAATKLPRKSGRK